MPVVESSVIVALPVDLAFAVSQTTGSIRMRWDPFVRRQYFLDGALTPDTGVRTVTVHRLGFRMISEYVSYHPPTNVGMKMVTGSWFFERMGGGWRFTPVEGQPDSTRAVWKYNVACRPRFLAPIAERIGRIILQRDIDRRIAGYARGCADSEVVAAARAAAGS
ncbi:MAG: SRPBCC family protein [Rhodococcus sp. (in: high G+C Gram-positive bacteria)]